MVVKPESRKEWNKQKNAVIAERDKLQSKINNLSAKAERKGWSDKKLQRRIGDKGKRTHLLNSTINTLGDLEDSDQVYSLSTEKGKAGETTYNNGVVNFQFDGSTSNFVHETTHGGQFESGDIGFSKSSGMALGLDVYDEIDAYINQYAYDPNSLGGKSMSGITPSWIRTIKNNNGNLIYGNNVGVYPINSNSTTTTLKRAYPNAGIQNAPKNQSNIRLGQYPNFYGNK